VGVRKRRKRTMRGTMSERVVPWGPAEKGEL